KPTQMLKHLVAIGSSKEGDIVLDFFAGSGSLAHSVFEVEVEDGLARRVISVQLPEKTKREDFETIADIGKERIRKAGELVRKEHPDHKCDLGFKFFKLDSSNIKAWTPNRADIESSLIDHDEHLVDGRSEEDVLYELLLKRGVDLAAPIEQKDILGKSIYCVGYGVLFVCLDEKVLRDQVDQVAEGITNWHKELAPASDTQVVFRDSAFEDDVAKTNMTAILKQNGIAHVRSL
ncbi:MAG: site-specific DNA-methyltransferase, partial [Candidatus Thiodiazotropha endolucinida]|nr:site-specific DNA-methyltransferase [Candidatus Thiodiazotropha taylori]MCW4315534.1 site-specific DNA-methyltransferase [Candidatus Thiodiazotropha taylori]